MQKGFDPNQLGIAISISIVIIVIWITLIPPFILPIEYIGIGLSIIAIVLTLVIFSFQWKIAQDQTRILAKNEDFESSQKYFVHHNISLILFRLLCHLKELRDIIEIIQEEQESEFVNDDPLAVGLTDLEDEDKQIKIQIEELTSVGIMGNPLIHEIIKEQIRRIKESYRNGPVFLYPDHLHMSHISFVIYEVEACQQMINDEKFMK